MSRRVLLRMLPIAILLLAFAVSPARARQNSAGPSQSTGSQPAPSPSGADSAAPDDSDSAARRSALIEEAEKRFDQEASDAEEKLQTKSQQPQQAQQAQIQPDASASRASAVKPIENQAAISQPSKFGADLDPPRPAGIPVREVHPGTRAEKAGLRAGDLITHLDGRQTRSIADFCDRLKGAHHAKFDRLEITRGKSRISLLLPAEARQPAGANLPNPRE